MEDHQISFFRRVREGYLKMAKEEPDRFRVIPGRKSKEKIAGLIAKEVDKLLAKRQ
jgi:thymidylate kinase